LKKKKGDDQRGFTGKAIHPSRCEIVCQRNGSRKGDTLEESKKGHLPKRVSKINGRKVSMFLGKEMQSRLVDDLKQVRDVERQKRGCSLGADLLAWGSCCRKGRNRDKLVRLNAQAKKRARGEQFRGGRVIGFPRYEATLLASRAGEEAQIQKGGTWR